MTTTTKKTPAWLIERVAQGELAPVEVEQIRARLRAEGRSLDAELDALRVSSRDILARLSGDRMVPAIRERAARLGRPAPAPRLRLPVLLAPTLLVGAAALAIVVARGKGGASGHHGLPESAPVEEIGIKGDALLAPRLLVYRQKPAKAPGPAGSERLPDGARAARGDVLQLAYDKAPEGLWGVLLSIDGAGRVTQHLPEEGAQAAAPLVALREIPLPSAYELDDAPGFERFVLVTSARTFGVAPVLDAARALVRQGGAARTLPLPLDPSYHQTAVLLHKTGKGAP